MMLEDGAVLVAFRVFNSTASQLLSSTAQTSKLA
jgi:hypothetical protein